MTKFLCLAVCFATVATSTLPCRAGVVINEIMANNQSAVRNEGAYPDWVEVFNTGPSPVDLQGMTLTDNLNQPAKFTFNRSYLLGVGQAVVVWCDNSTRVDGFHAAFSLSNTGEEVGLFDSLGRKLDSIKFGIQPLDLSISRIPSGTGDWVLSVPTLLAANEVQPLGDARKVVINEWMASPALGDDWIELHNPDLLPVAVGGFYASDATLTPATNRPLRALSFIAAEGYLQLFASGLAKTDPDHLDFKLSNGGETLSLFGSDARTLLNRVVFARQDPDISQGRLPDGAESVVSFPLGKATPAASNLIPITNVVINEVLTHTDFPYEDAIELYNPTPLPADISNWWLSNAKNDAKKYRFPLGSVIQPQQFRVVYEYQFDPDNSGTGTSFRFNSARGDECFLYSADANGTLLGGRTSVKVLAAENGVSWGRYQTSQGHEFVPMERLTFGMDQPGNLPQFRSGQGLPNPEPKIGPIVISEIMYHPASEVLTNDNTLDEYIELRNLRETEVGLHHPLTDLLNVSNVWNLAGLVSFSFPLGTVLQARESVLVVSFDPVLEPSVLATFRGKFGVSGATRIFGPFHGKLSNGGGSLELYKPDEIQRPPHPDAGLIPLILVEKIKYDDVAPWPPEADGTGAALQRKDLKAFGNDPLNWFAGVPTPGRGSPPRLAPIFTSIAHQSQEVVLKFVPEKGVHYGLEYLNSLEARNWLSLSNQVQIIDSSSEATVTDRLPSDTRMRYYRIVAPID